MAGAIGSLAAHRPLAEISFVERVRKRRARPVDAMWASSRARESGQTRDCKLERPRTVESPLRCALLVDTQRPSAHPRSRAEAARRVPPDRPSTHSRSLVARDGSAAERRHGGASSVLVRPLTQQFNDALIARGIIAPRPERTPSPEPPPPEPRRPHLSDDDDDLLDEDEDALPSSVLERYRAERLADLRARNTRARFGEILPITKSDYTREVTEASRGDGRDPNGLGVVCFLYKARGRRGRPRLTLAGQRD